MSQAITKTDTPDQIDCLLIPLKDKNLLLPNVSVAEIIPFSHLLTTASSVDWILGRIDWRGTPVPVLCYEMLNRQPAPAPNPNARFAIVNGVVLTRRCHFMRCWFRVFQAWCISAKAKFRSRSHAHGRL